MGHWKLVIPSARTVSASKYRAPQIHKTPLSGINSDTATNAVCRLDRSRDVADDERRDGVAQGVDDQDVDGERGGPDVGADDVGQDRCSPDRC